MIIKRFAEQVKRTPRRTAIKTPEISLTYEELDRYANRVAHEIVHTHGLGGSGAHVGLLFDHGVHMIAGLLASLKAGIPYVPLSPGNPESRLSYMISDADISLIVSDSANKELAGRLAAAHKNEVLDSEELAGSGIIESPEAVAGDDDLMYILYTSGSTGRPKGVMQTHRNACHFIDRYKTNLQITENDRMTLISSFSHDAGMLDIYSALSSGAALHPLDVKKPIGTASLTRWLEEEEITLWHSAPSIFRYFFNRHQVAPHLPCLRLIVLGGEAILRTDIEIYRDYFPRSLLYLLYGQTESSYVSGEFITARQHIKHITLGTPVAETKMFVIDEEDAEVDEYEVGEIVVSTPYISPGYWKNGEATEKVFSRDDEWGLLYFTGDLGRLLPGPGVRGCTESRIEFVNRRDFQVKLRGYRIEPGEIESHLSKVPGIREAAVVVKELSPPGAAEGTMKDKYLCAYIVLRDAEPTPPSEGISHLNPVGARRAVPAAVSAVPSAGFDEGGRAASLRTFLAQTLPDYMIPTYFTYLDRFPLTQSGKIDRGAFPDPGIGTGTRYEAPRTPEEEKLVDIWVEVLGVEKEEIGIDADFFELGGHSLRGTTMLSEVHREFNVKIPVVKIFQTPTIRDLAAYIKKSVKSVHHQVEPVEKKDYYPLSSAQRRLYILQQMDTEQGTAYNISNAWQLEGGISVEKLEKSFRELIRRHESLRTYFTVVNSEPAQRIHEPENIKFNINYYKELNKSFDRTFSKVRPPGGAITWQGIKPEGIHDLIRPFDLSKAPLLRVGLNRINEQSHILTVDMHHIISDGHSMGILIKDFLELHGGMKLSGLRLQYKDFSHRQNGMAQNESIKQQESYWVDRFSGETPVLELPMDYPRPAVQNFTGVRLSFALNKEETAALKNLSREKDITMFMLLLSIYTILLSKLSGHEDIVVGTPIAGRRHADLQGIIGMFVNILVLRNFPVMEKTFDRYLSELKADTIDAYDNQEYQYEDLVERVKVDRDTGRNPLFDASFVFRNMEAPVSRAGGLSAAPYGYESKVSKFDMTLAGEEAQEYLGFSIEYCTKLFKPETIQRFILYFKRIISAVCRTPGIKISAVEIIDEQEKNRLLYEFNDTAADYPADRTIHQLFEERAVKNPGHTAVVHEDKQITYGELNEQANRLAVHLIEKGVAAGDIVGIVEERSIELIAGLLGILKAGAAYLPMDIHNPQERIDYMLRDSGAKLLTAHESPGTNGQPQGLPLHSTHLSSVPLEATSIAYVIYTSGTTGRPKGVCIERRSVVNMICSYEKVFSGEKRMRRSQVANPAFDAMAYEIWPCLTAGAALFIAGENARLHPGKMKEWLIKQAISISFQPTPIAEQLLKEEWPVRGVGLRVLQAAGDRLTFYPERTYPFRIYNLYGPTESTVWTTWAEIKIKEAGDPAYPVIGVPIDNLRVYIMTPALNLCSIGVAGELCIAGDGVAPGYLNRPELTAEKFASGGQGGVFRENCPPAPPAKAFDEGLAGDNYPNQKFCSNFFKSLAPGRATGGKLYKSGDLARWLSDSNIEFIGRIDQQVKIRGYRIELGEIENRLHDHKSIGDAVVITGGRGGDKHLCAYITAAGELDVPGLRDYLSRDLPDYMIPSYFVQVDKIPLTPSGKVDRKALAQHKGKRMATGTAYVAASTDIEKIVAGIWKDVLVLDQVGIDDNFFALGGNSLKAIVVATEIHKALNIEIPLGEIFSEPHIRGLAAYIKRSVRSKYFRVNPVEKKSHYVLSYNQERLWFIHQRDPRSPAYNMSEVIELSHAVNRDILKKVIAELCRRHESLRTAFTVTGDEPAQVIAAGLEELPLREIDLSVFAGDGQEQRWQPVFKEESNRVFDLTKAPLIRFLLVKLSEEQYKFIYIMHHIISDGWSMHILKKEIIQLYGSYLTGEPVESASLRVCCRDFAEWSHRRMADSAAVGESHRYWKEIVEQGLPQLELPRRISGDRADISGSTYRYLMDPELKRKLEKIGNSHGTTLFTVLFTIYLVVLSRYSPGPDIVCSIISAGRSRESFHPIIGFFVNSILFNIRVHEDESFSILLRRVRDATLEYMRHQDYPLEKVFEELKMRYPEIPVAFNMFNLRETVEIEPFAPHHVPDGRDVKFDLEVYAIEYENGIDMAWVYKKSLFIPEVVESVVKDYIKLLEFFSADPGKSVRDFKSGSPGQKRTFRKKRK